MTHLSKRLYRYSNSPEIFGNPVLSSIQLFFWLIFHPSAWANFIKNNIGSQILPSFALTDLDKNYWSKSKILLLVFQAFVIWPLIISLISSLFISIIQFAYIGQMTIDLANGIEIEVESNILNGLAFGLVFGILSGLVLGTVFNFAVGISTMIVLSLVCSITWGLASEIGIAAACGLSAGISGSVAIITYQENVNYRFSRLRQLGATTSGLIIGSLVFILAIIIADFVVSLLANQTKDYGLYYGPVFGGWIGLAIGFVRALRTGSWRKNLSISILAGIIFGILGGLMLNLDSSARSQLPIAVAIGIQTSGVAFVMFVLPFYITDRLAGPRAGGIAAALGSGSSGILFVLQYLPSETRTSYVVVACISSIIIGLSLNWWRPVITYPLTAIWNQLLLWFDKRSKNQQSSLLHLNAAFWDEYQWLPLSGLDEHLVFLANNDLKEGQAAIDYISTTTNQSWAAREAQIELRAQQLEQCSSVSEIADIHAELKGETLQGSIATLLRRLSVISADVESALKQSSKFNQRIVLGEVEDRLEGLLWDITGSNDRYLARFRSVVKQWTEIIQKHRAILLKQAEIYQEIPNPYIVGVPLTGRQTIFKGRTNISSIIEGIVREQDTPPLLLYGQRRMGKTSLLYQLRWMLPNWIVPLVIDLQGPITLAKGHTGFLYNLTKSMRTSAKRQKLILPELSRSDLNDDPFTSFDDWLDQVETILVRANKNTFLLAFDEFEALDEALLEDRFKEQAILGTLRHIIQHRPRFKLLLAGSHTLNEFQRWSSYLINAQTLHLTCLDKEQAFELIEYPIDEFPLAYEAEARKHVFDITQGHPYLLQLLCGEVVSLKNRQDIEVRQIVKLSDVEAIVPEILLRGHQFFADLAFNQIDEQGRALLRYLAIDMAGKRTSRDKILQYLPKLTDLNETINLLLRREIIKQVDDEYQFQTKIVQRWFANNFTVETSREEETPL